MLNGYCLQLALIITIKHNTLVTQLTIFDICIVNNSTNYNLLCQPSKFFQAVLR